MSEITQYDAIIIGAGQAGVPLAVSLAGAGWKTAIVEREHAGGTCVNEGCIPTKSMVASARGAYLARSTAKYGVQTSPVGVDMERIRQRKRDIVESFRSGNEQRLINPGADLLMGEASFRISDFKNRHAINVRLNTGDTRQLTASTIFINTGAQPAMPSLPSLELVPAFDSTSIMDLDSVPEYLLGSGGGYIGLEFGQMFRRFGSKVITIQRGKQLLSREDGDVAEEVTNILREDGIEVLLETHALPVEQKTDGLIYLTVRTIQAEGVFTGSHLLVATDRKPNTMPLTLEAAGVKTDRGGFIVVNECLETNAPGIYTLGDIKGGPTFTHISYDDFRIIAPTYEKAKI